MPAIAHYWREIVVVLVVKIAAIYAIHEAYFDQPVGREARIGHLSDNVYRQPAAPGGHAHD